MARAIWKGVIAFGMVTIPVRLLSATEAKDVSFHLLHRKDHARLKTLRWCPVDKEEVPWEEVVRGYEFAEGEYVVLDDEDFEKLPLPSKNTIEISAFVEAGAISPAYHERGYYLEPEETGAKPYRLLLKALESKELVAIGKVAFRNREHLCALRPMDGTILLETLLYADEVRKRPKIPEADVSKRELETAFGLIELLRESFNPKKYHNEYQDALREMIEAKQRGKEVVEPPAAPEAKVIDLMDALRASVEAAQHKGTGGQARRQRRKAS